MKQMLISAVVAAIVSGAVVYALGGRPEPKAPASATASAAPGAGGLTLHYTDSLAEDVWIDASRTAGADHRSLTDADNSICFITKIELSGIASPDDTSSCTMKIDDFTGFWDLAATVEEGGRSSIRCNARCLIWE